MKYLLYLFLFIYSPIFSQSQLDLKEIMKGNDFIGHSPENVQWSVSGDYIYFDWNPNMNPESSLYRFDLKKQSIDSVTIETLLAAPLYSRIQNDQFMLFTMDGDLFRYDRKKQKSQLILAGASSIYNLQIANLEDKFYFQQDQSLFSYDPSTGFINEEVRFMKGFEPSSGKESVIANEERQHFQFLQEEENASGWRKENRLKSPAESKLIYLENKRFSSVQVSPDGRFITFRIDEYPSNENTEVMHYIVEDGNASTRNARSKVHDNDPNHFLRIFDRDTDSVYTLNIDELPDIKKKPHYLAESDSVKYYDHNRNVFIHELHYSDDGKYAITSIKSYDNKSRWILSLDLAKNDWSVIDHQVDSAWIGGPGISNWNMVEGNVGFVPNSSICYFQSEESGYSHLITYDLATKKNQYITSGNWEVHDVHPSKDGRLFYLVHNKTHPGNRGFSSITINGNNWHDLLTKVGNYEPVLSPDNSKIAFRYSYKNQPWELFVQENKTNTKATQITSSTTEAFKSYNWYEPEVTSFKNNNGGTTYARVYKPDSDVKNGAAIIFVHGAGYLQNAHNYWSGYYREYMFHNLLRDKGYTILDIDYQASKGYGRDHRTAIYRNMGGADLDDQLLGKRYLIDSLGIDEDRVGIYGGSYGGFITLMALLKAPGEFKCGAALRSVTDWLHYNHEYTSNILNYPSLDTEAYRRSSPIYFAENLQDRLLMLHGMVDDNVQFQDVVRLSEKFIELGKKNWDVAIYPVEAHSFRKSYSWYDEYRRILELFNEELLNNGGN
jgi:dipeptidyl aminopeptidase/acylaminoacyl peptidase